MDKSNSLIDFSSPAQKNKLKPLIPVPPQTSYVPKEIDEPSADPFDVQEIVPDPFECVLQCALNNSDLEQNSPVHIQSSPNSQVDKSLIHILNDSTNSKISSKVETPGTIQLPDHSPSKNSEKPTPPEHVTPTGSEISGNCTVDLNNSDNTSANKNAEEILKNSSKSSVVLESDNQSQISADFSTEESLKAAIAKRVNRCIQEVLNGSMKSNQNANDTVFKKPENKRSLSFIGLSIGSDKKGCDRLNKSCTDVNNSFNLENQELDASSNASDFGLLSPDCTNVSGEDHLENHVYKEARKISRTFSKLAESFRQEQESDSDDEDLMSCKPRWMYTESSEDEGEKLLKDPALNFRRRSDNSVFSSPAPQPSKVTDSPALLAYRTRRSLTNVQAALNDTQEELTLKRSISVGSHLKEVPLIHPPANIVPVNLMKTDDQPIKLRKKIFGDAKKGPLRAVMPIQNMTKEPLAVAGILPSKKDTSPEARIQKSISAMRTPNKDNSQLNITPMASSTPNKAESFVGSNQNARQLLKPMASVAANKRHSLEGSFGHKSRGALLDGGARPRSNSANSSIPRVSQVKPLRGLPLTPKSTSNLGRAANTQENTNVKCVGEKKNASLLKSSRNPRVLTEVKTKPSGQSRVKTAVSTLSNLVRGKKSAARDKENRVPA